MQIGLLLFRSVKAPENPLNALEPKACGRFGIS